MDLINPFEDVSKAATWPPQGATVIRALLPTGKHVGHGLDLSVTRHKGGGGKRAGLEHYRGKGTKLGTKFGKSVAEGLGMVSRQAKPSWVPQTSKQSSRVKPNQGRNALRRDLSMNQLRSQVNFGDGARQGRRVV